MPNINGKNSFTKVSDDSMVSNTYNNQLKVVTVSNRITVYSYKGSSSTWTARKIASVECFGPKLTTAQGNLYMLTSPATSAQMAAMLTRMDLLKE